MPDPLRASYHADRVIEYVHAWCDRHADAHPGAPPDPAAYSLLEHAGMLWRYTGDAAVIAGLRSLGDDETVELIDQAVRYIRSLLLAEDAERILSWDRDVRDEDLETLATVLVRRDVLEVVLDLAEEVAGELATTNLQVRDALGEGRGRAESLDEILRPHRNELSFAAGEVLARDDDTCDEWRSQVEGDRYWWLGLGQTAEALRTKTLDEVIADRTPDEVIADRIPAVVRFRDLVRSYRWDRLAAAAAAADEREISEFRARIEALVARIPGEDAIAIRFGLEPHPDRNGATWSVWLVGPPAAIGRYEAVELTLGTGSLRAPIDQIGLAILDLDPASWRALRESEARLAVALIRPDGAVCPLE